MKPFTEEEKGLLIIAISKLNNDSPPLIQAMNKSKVDNILKKLRE